MAYDSWTLTDLKHREKKIADKFFALYPLPTTNYAPLPKTVEEVSLEDEDFNPTNRWLTGYRLFGEEHIQDRWVTMLVDVVKELYKRFPDALEAMAYKRYWIHPEAADETKKYERIAEGCYLWRYANNRNKLVGLRYIFDELNIAYAELQLFITPLPSDVTNCNININSEVNKE